jgi:hypothetical protein
MRNGRKISLRTTKELQMKTRSEELCATCKRLDKNELFEEIGSPITAQSTADFTASDEIESLFASFNKCHSGWLDANFCYMTATPNERLI